MSTPNLYAQIIPYVFSILQDCCICCDSLKNADSDNSSGDSADSEGPDPVFKLNKCGHMFHKSCLVAMYNSGTKVSKWSKIFEPWVCQGTAD